MTFRSASLFATLVLAIVLAIPAAFASEVVIQVTEVKSDAGEIGCALFSSSKGFPMERANAKLLWQPAKRDGVTCRFRDLEPGQYAVAVSHDLNGNRLTDTKIFGIPKEDWGVSNNVRPRMRAPKFREAAFPLAEGETVRIEIKVGR